MEDIKRYKHLNEYYKEKFGERTLKICIDGGFTCPNRDGTLSYGGCIYCSEKGSGELITNVTNDLKNLNNLDVLNNSANLVCLDNLNKFNANLANKQNISYISKNITEQVKHYFTTYRAGRANKFIVYFQNFTNTYDTVQNLKIKYDSALVDDRIIGISIGTRPDCITEEIALLLNSYTDKYYVCVELGLQTANDEIRNKINCGYTSKHFSQAVKILNKYNIDVITHIMVGLPNETMEDIKNTVNFVNNHKLQGVKIHSTYVVENTKLEEMYKNGEYKALDLDDYIETLIDILTHLNPEFVIHRISGDAPKDILVAPYWNKHKMWILHGFEKRFKARDLWQGKFYNKDIPWK